MFVSSGLCRMGAAATGSERAAVGTVRMRIGNLVGTGCSDGRLKAGVENREEVMLWATKSA